MKKIRLYIDGKGVKIRSAKYMVIVGESLKLTSNFKEELQIATDKDNQMDIQSKL